MDDPEVARQREIVIARDAIRQLAYRYAWCMDTRDIDGLVGLRLAPTRNRCR